MKTTHFFLILSFFGLVSFTRPEELTCRKSGITGYVRRVSGNQMPSPDQPPATPRGMKTILYIYELTNMNQVSRDGVSAFYTSIATKLVKKVETKEDGSFKVKLKPGQYSLFVKKGELFYANSFDGENNIYPVEVKKSEMTEVTFRADYGAAY